MAHFCLSFSHFSQPFSVVTFRVSRRRREMYCGHARLRDFVPVRVRMPTPLHGPGCNLREWYGMPPSCAPLGGFAIGARVALLYGKTRNAWQSPAVIRQAHCTPHALRMPAKSPLASDKIDAPAACATLSATKPFHFVHTAGVL